METKDMNKGVQILLERMDSNPEEFHTGNGKWLDVISVIVTRMKQLAGEPVTANHRSLCPLEDDEVITLNNKLREIAAKEFTHTVMNRLLTANYEANYDSSMGGKLKTAIANVRLKV